MARWLQALSTRACLQVFNNCHSARRLLHGEKLLGIISTKGKMSKRFKCNIYTKCYCFLKFRSGAAQNLCDSLYPEVHPTHTAMQNRFPTQSPIPPPCRSGASSIGSWRDVWAPQCPSTLHVAPFCQPCYPRIMALWEVALSVCMTYITVQAFSPAASLPCLVLPPATPHHCAKLSSSAHQSPTTSLELCSSCSPHPSKNQWAVTVICRF